MIKLAGTPFEPPDGPYGGDDDIAFDPSEFEVEYECEADAGDDAGPGECYAPEYPGECTAVFAPDGELRAAADRAGRLYEFRPQQQRMAEAIATALVNGENLCVEAPTGVGKSFAYLVPLILRARYGGRPAVVSTETINLQEQLIERDIPMLREVLGIDFKAALAKGRHNYLCRRRFAMLTGAERDALLPAPSLALDIDRLAKWIELGNSGALDGVDFKLDPATWGLVCCESGACAGPKCQFYRSCFYYQARRKWEEADIIVANHALFFTDLAMRFGDLSAGTLLPNYGAVLIDEAHTLENNAAAHLGLHFSRQSIVGELNRLYNPDSARGLLMRPGSGILEVRAVAAEARDEAYGFFTPYENFLADRRESAARLGEELNFPDRLSGKLLQLSDALDRSIEAEEDDAFRVELESHRDRCRSLADDIVAFDRREISNAVYYVESEARGGITLHAAPLNVAELLRKLLFDQDFPVHLCSATLTVGRKFDYYIGRTGYTGGATLLLDSPFSPDQAQLLLPAAMPDPASSEFDPALADEIFRRADMVDGGTFVLFTNYQSLRFCAAKLRERFALRGRQLLVQGEELGRSQMLREFKRDGRAVLFGTDSFWTGVDVPGEALSQVIVTKLPFPNPRHPLTAAREEEIKKTGASSFANYSLPEAVLKFRQGIGRLIRNRADRGTIVVLDRRVISKSYGRVFLNSIPYRPQRG